MSATNEANEAVGRYALSRKLATGGMAEAWLARQLSGGPERLVVLKMLLPELCEDPDFVKMFLDEARLASALKHPNIVSVFDLGRLDERYFIAMQYVVGKTLRQVVQRLRRDNRRLPVWFALSVAIKTCEALGYAHRACDDEGWPLNLVHRDVTPENVMVGYDGTISVLDFGIAKVSARGTRTRAGVMKGKHAYLAPEQILAVETGCAVDHRADLYSLGVMLYELVTATRPFDADNELSLIHSIVDAESRPQPPRALAPWLEPGIEAVILRAMARDPSTRFDDAGAMRNALVECLAVGGQHPTERHIGGMLSLLFAEDEASPRSAEPWKASSSDADSFVVPAPGLCDGPSVGGPRAAVAPEDLEPETRGADTPVPGAMSGPPRHSGFQPTEAATAARADLSGELMEMCGAPASRDADRHCWDLMLDRLRTDRESAPSSVRPRAVAGPPEPAASPALSRSRGSAPPTVDPRRQARLEFDQGLEHHRNGEIDAAAQALERAVELDPENRLYRTNLRMLLRSRDR